MGINTALKGVLFDVQRFSLNDGPGIRTNLFFKGCPLRCLWCHNPEGLLKTKQLSFRGDKCALCGACAAACPNGAHKLAGDKHELNRALCAACGKCAEACVFDALELVGKDYTVSEALAEALRDESFYSDGGGVTLTGGEPMAQSEFAIALAEALNARGVGVCLETSGFCEAEALERIAKYIDYFLFDIKETDAQKHREYTGADLNKIHANLRLLDRLGAKIVLRCPLIPGLNARAEHFDRIAELANELGGVVRIDIEPYHSLGLSKREQLGMEGGFSLASGMPREEAERWLDYLKLRTEKFAGIS